MFELHHGKRIEASTGPAYTIQSYTDYFVAVSSDETGDIHILRYDEVRSGEAKLLDGNRVADVMSPNISLLMKIYDGLRRNEHWDVLLENTHPILKYGFMNPAKYITKYLPVLASDPLKQLVIIPPEGSILSPENANLENSTFFTTIALSTVIMRLLSSERFYEPDGVKEVIAIRDEIYLKYRVELEEVAPECYKNLISPVSGLVANVKPTLGEVLSRDELHALLEETDSGHVLNELGFWVEHDGEVVATGKLDESSKICTKRFQQCLRDEEVDLKSISVRIEEDTNEAIPSIT